MEISHIRQIESRELTLKRFSFNFRFSLTKGQCSKRKTIYSTIRIGSTPTFLYFDLYLYSAYEGHYVYDIKTVFFHLHGQTGQSGESGQF